MFGCGVAAAVEQEQPSAAQMMDDLMYGHVPIGGPFTLTDQTGEVTGTARYESGEPATDHAVFIYAPDELSRTVGLPRIAISRPTIDGSLWPVRLAPGQYRLATVLDSEPGSWLEPDFIRRIDPGSTTFRIAAGERKVLDLRVRAPR